MTQRKPSVLILIDYYLPGYLAGGPVRSMINFVAALGDDFDLFILTTDHDLKQTTAYPNIIPGEWYTVGKAHVCYLSPSQATLNGLRKRIREIPFDLLYVNGVFPTSSVFTALLRKFGLIPYKPIIIAPRGHLGKGSLNIKFLKKFVFLTVARILSLYRDVIWHVASSEEIAGIRAAFSSERPQIVVIPNLPTVVSAPLLQEPVVKRPSQARIAFLSRIVPIKNLEFLLLSLHGIRGELTVDIWGPIEDEVYWERCQALIKALPPSIRVEYCGAVEPEQVVNTLNSYHLFYLPTQHENFGHVILEAMLAGCPVLISDHTPWKQLEMQGIGWDLPLDNSDRFCQAVQQIIDMDSEEWTSWSKRVHAFAITYIQQSPAVEQTRQFLLDAANFHNFVTEIQ